MTENSRTDGPLDRWAQAGAAAGGLTPVYKKYQASPTSLWLQLWYVGILEKLGRFKPDPAPDWLIGAEERFSDALGARLAIAFGRSLAKRVNDLELASPGGGTAAVRFLDDIDERCGTRPPRWPFPIGGGWRINPAELLLIAGQLHAAATLSGSAALAAAAKKFEAKAAV